MRATVEALLESGSYLSLVPMQDVFGWTDRINTPSVVNDLNWTWRVPRPVDAWAEWPEAAERQSWLRDLTRAPAAERGRNGRQTAEGRRQNRQTAEGRRQK